MMLDFGGSNSSFLNVNIFCFHHYHYYVIHVQITVILYINKLIILLDGKYFKVFSLWDMIQKKC